MQQVNINLIIIIFSVLSNIAFSQTSSNIASFKIGKGVSRAYQARNLGFVYQDESGYYNLKIENLLSGGKEYIVERFDQEMNFVEINRFRLKYNGKPANYEGRYTRDGIVYFFSSTKNDNGDNLLLRQSLNLETLDLNNDLIVLAKVDAKDFPKSKKVNFLKTMSSGESRSLVLYDMRVGKNEKTKYRAIVLDENGEEIFTKIINFPYEDRRFSIRNYNLDENGDLHFLSKVFRDKDNKNKADKEESNFFYEYFKFTNQFQSMEQFPIKEKDKNINNVNFKILDNGNVVFAGLYSIKNYKNARGTFWLKIDGKSKEIITKNFHEFSTDFITQHLANIDKRIIERGIEKGKDVGLSNVSLKRTILNKDGSAFIIGEQYERKVESGTAGSASPYYSYRFNDIMVIRINKDGEIDWTRKIPKYQATATSPEYCSYYLHVGNKLKFIFNDHPKNSPYPGDGKLKSYKLRGACNLVLVTMDSQGEMEKEVLYESAKGIFFMAPRYGTLFSENEVLLFGANYSVQKFAKIIFN